MKYTALANCIPLIYTKTINGRFQNEAANKSAKQKEILLLILKFCTFRFPYSNAVSILKAKKKWFYKAGNKSNLNGRCQW